METKKLGKAPNLASITPGKNIVALYSKLWKKCRGGGGHRLKNGLFFAEKNKNSIKNIIGWEEKD